MNSGRFPSHLLLSHSMDCTQTDCVADCPVRALDEQSGTSKDSAGGYNWSESNNDNPVHVIKNIKRGIHYGDQGGASRYFQQFRPTQENPRGDLLQYLARLITPPDGVVLTLFSCDEEGQI